MQEKYKKSECFQKGWPSACGPASQPGAKLIETDHSGAETQQINEHHKRLRRRQRGEEKKERGEKKERES